MDATQITAWLGSVPWWTWAIGIIILLSLFGDKKIWEFEVDFAFRDGIGKGEVEIEHYTNRKPMLEIELDLEPAYVHRELEVLRNGKQVLLIPATTNVRSRLRIHEPYRGEQPGEGDLIEVKCAGETLFSGTLRRD